MGAGLGVRSILPTVWEGALFREEQKIFCVRMQLFHRAKPPFS
jgi:hypothetical protein